MLFGFTFSFCTGGGGGGSTAGGGYKPTTGYGPATTSTVNYNPLSTPYEEDVSRGRGIGPVDNNVILDTKSTYRPTVAAGKLELSFSKSENVI